jgi:ATP-dependent helicase/nuclease subunit B
MTASIQILADLPCLTRAEMLGRFRTCDRLAMHWLVSTRRAARALRAQLGAGLGPHVLTFQQLADDIVAACEPESAPLSAIQQRMWIDQVLDALGPELPDYQGIRDTRAFPTQTLGMIAELKQNKVSPRDFAAGAQNDRDRQRAAIYSAYHERLRQANRYDPPGRCWRALEHLQAGWPAVLAPLEIVFITDLDHCTPVQQALLELVARHCRQMTVSLTDQENDDRSELFRGSRRLMEEWSTHFGATRVAAQATSRYRLPAGLEHLQNQLFRSRRTLQRSANLDGLLFLEAPGAVGEARMAAREICCLLNDGASPGSIVVAVRHLPASVDLLQETFAEYDLPVDIEGEAPLARNSAVSTLLRAARLADDDWPFGPTTALLRSGYFRPNWPEVSADPEVAQRAEALLRLLREPGGREAYLTVVRRWALEIPKGLEDEEALQKRREQTHDLAKRALGFFERFFAAWDDAPKRGTPAQFADWLKTFAERLGMTENGVGSFFPADREALVALFRELSAWAQHFQPARGRGLLTRIEFGRVLASLAFTAGLPRTPRGPGRVRILSAEAASVLQVDHLLVLALGEGGFPQLAPPASLLDDGFRQQMGWHPASPADRLASEMRLFFRLVSAAQKRLVLSYPAVDEKGQTLLPCSFLLAVRDCFLPECLKDESAHLQHRRMLIQGVREDVPLSPAEVRVRLAQHWHAQRSTDAVAGGLPDAVVANLRAAAGVAKARFATNDFTPYDGWLANPAIQAELATRFGPGTILSPTALENYVACPFKFFVRSVLKVAPLEEPPEEIESTNQGQAFHRALARLHGRRKESGAHHPDDAVNEELLRYLDDVIKQEAERSSHAGKVLWDLEGKRLKRFGQRYGSHWRKHVKAWNERAIYPRPELLEVAFGLPTGEDDGRGTRLVVCVDGIEVSVSGRIDRIDIAELPDDQGLGFWVIDYKTGRGANYVARELHEFKKLQLTLYALAAEEVLLAGRRARPMGLAYWLVAEKGVKTGMPGHHQATAWLDDASAWERIRVTLRSWIVRLARGIRAGEFPLKPRSESCTATCDFGEVCRIGQVRKVVERKTWRLPLPMTD